MGVTIREPRPGSGILKLYAHRDGKRWVKSLGRISWEQAQEKADELQQLLDAGVLDPAAIGLRFGEFADRYLREATGHLAATTRDDREGLLGPEGRLRSYFDTWRLDAIRRPQLVEWWAAEVEGRGRAVKTGRNYLDALAGVFGYAVDLELILEDPVEQFRAILRRRGRSKRARGDTVPGRDCRPLETVADVEAFVDASRKAGGEGHVADLLQLDAGLRLGEVGGLEWPDAWYGKDADDEKRALRIHATRPRGRGPGGERPKSGRERTVALSRRLRAALLELWIARGRPEAGRVVVSSSQSNYRKRHFARVCKAAKLGDRRPKDLRDTFASQLLTVGVPLGYVSQQLGHADVAVTARHYAKYLGGEGFRTPLALAPGEVPADLLARLAGDKRAGRRRRSPRK